MKENIYQTERGLMAWGYAMFLLFAMICVVILSIAVKYWRVRKAFQRDKEASVTKNTNASDKLITGKGVKQADFL
jgi:hypothetical protein